MVRQHTREKGPAAPRTPDIRGIVGRNLQGILKSLSWGVPEFQQRTGFSSHFLAGVIRGDQNVSIDNLHVMALALGFEAHQLLNPRFEAPQKPQLMDMLERSNREVSALREGTAASITPPRAALAHHLRRLLAFNGLSAGALAHDIGAAPSTLQKCLKGTQNVTIDTLGAIAEGLGVTPFVLVLPIDP